MEAPTEAQLRWAQFHHHRTAEKVRQKIELLYQTPQSIADVPDAHSEDGASSCGTPEEISIPRQVPYIKPQLSKGRRALLKVSQRKYQQRKQELLEEDKLSAIFTTTETTTKRRLRNNDKERLQRFEEAVQAMMTNIANQQQQEPEIETPTKIWTRPDVPKYDLLFTQDYLDLKWGVVNNKEHDTKKTPANTLPMDKGASWLVHLPPSQKKRPPILSPEIRAKLNNATTNIEEESIVHHAFDELVLSLQNHFPQQQSMARSEPPTMRLQKYFTLLEEEQKDNDTIATNLDDTFAETQSAEKRLTTYAKQLEGLLDKNLVQSLHEAGDTQNIILRCLEEAGFNPLLDDNVRTVLPYVEVLARKYLSGLLDNETDDGTPFSKAYKKGRKSGFVRKLVESFQENQEELVSADGKLHKVAFAELVNRYLKEASSPRVAIKAQTLFADGEEKKESSVVQSHDQVDDIVNKFLERMESVKLKMKQGKIDLQNLENVMTKHFAQASGADEDTVQEAADLESLVSLNQRKRRTSSTFVDRMLFFFEESRRTGNDFAKMVVRDIEESPVSRYMRAIESAEYQKSRNVVVEKFVNEIQHRVASAAAKFDLLEAHGRQEVRALFVKSLAESSGSLESTVEKAQSIEDLTRSVFKGPTVSKEFTRNMISHIELLEDVDPIVTKGRVDREKLGICVSRFLRSRIAEQLEGGSVSSPVALARARVSARLSVAPSNEEPKYDPSFDLCLENSQAFIESFLGELDEAGIDEVAIDQSGGLNAAGLENLLGGLLETAMRDWKDKTTQEVYNTEEAERDLRNESKASGNAFDQGHSAQGMSGTVGRLRGILSEKVSSLAVTLKRSTSTSQDDQDGGKSTSNSELEAVAAFRRRFGARDDASQSSAYSVPTHLINALRQSDDLDKGERQEKPEQVETDNQESSQQMSSLHTKILTEGTESEDMISKPGFDPNRLSSLMLSPSLISKRLRQAMKAIESRNWEQIQYLLKANPWLAEMHDADTNQYLLHKLALFGSSSDDDSAPEALNVGLVRLFPGAVFKFDTDGNLPLHLAAASANLALIRILGDRFPSGASVRNEDGMLPLHLAILACSTDVSSSDQALQVVDAILGYFGQAVAVFDDEGNLPIHLAATVLKGDLGVETINLLVDEAEHLSRLSDGVRFRRSMHSDRLDAVEDDDTINTEAANPPTLLPIDHDTVPKSTDVYNLSNESPLLSSIHNHAGWEVVQALLRAPEGGNAAFLCDEEGNFPLHLVLGHKYQDLASALAILKYVPLACAQPNRRGQLPIEVACLNYLPREMILALVLADLPIKLDLKGKVEKREGRGLSWWYLTCDSEDQYLDVVEEVLSICWYQQARELCFTELETRGTLVTCASPKCQEALRKALRFVGRYEFLGKSVVHEVLGIKIFEALDFGTDLVPHEDGKRVYLRCYARRDVFDEETRIFRQLELDFHLVEEILTFNVGKNGMSSNGSESQQYCVSTEIPSLSLASVIKGMLKNPDCQQDPSLKQRYNAKVFAVLRRIGKGVRLLHQQGAVHGDLAPSRCGKFDESWKLTNIVGLQAVGEEFVWKQSRAVAPPEISSGTQVLATKAIDIWLFGALIFESIVGQSLDATNVKSEDDGSGLDLRNILRLLELAQMPDSGSKLVIRCLSEDPLDRPSIEDVLIDQLWSEVRKSKGK